MCARERTAKPQKGCNPTEGRRANVSERNAGQWVTLSNEIMEQKKMTKTDEYLTVEEAADYLGYSTSWLYELRIRGRGPTSWRNGHRLVYPKSGLDQFVANRRARTLRGEGV